MKRILILIIFGVLLSIFLSPILFTWVYSGREETEGVSIFKFVSLAGDYNIFIDDVFLGTVQHQKEKVFTGIKPGKRMLRVYRLSEVDNFYFSFVREVSFMPFTQVELEWEAGPTLESSNGVLKYFTEAFHSNNAELLIDPFPQDATISINNISIQNRLVEITDTQEKIIRVSHSDRYVPKDVKILLINPNTNAVPKNVRLNIEVYLYKRPI
jgi:hypothetical protein